MRTQMSGFKFFKFLMFSSVLGAGLFAARTASAACTNDIDCPNAACGGDICDWSVNDPAHECKPAGMHPKGEDGWCTTDADCKCMGAGAKCVSVFCTFVLPSQAPGAPATGGASGSTGGASGTGGASAGTGGASTGPKPASGDSGGCSVGGAASSTGLGAMVGLAALLISRRRRGRA
ncbi:MAG: MYXO-CTERM sorting domain-containing protein [Polyangia bacterium]